MANMPGSGLVESAALGPYLDGIARRLLGEALRLGHPPTWWCGDPRGPGPRPGQPRRLTLRPAATPQRGAGPRRDPGGRTPWRPSGRGCVAALRDRPFDYVAQEAAPLSTMPGWERGERRPRPGAPPLRAARLRGPDARRLAGHAGRLLPRLGARGRRPDRDAARHPLRRCLGPVREARSTRPLIGSQAAPRVRRIGGHLPSRAADGLFWLGRYLERAEAVIRLVARASAQRRRRGRGRHLGRPRHAGGPGAPRAPARVGRHRRRRTCPPPASPRRRWPGASVRARPAPTSSRPGATPPPCAPASPARPGGCSPT